MARFFSIIVTVTLIFVILITGADPGFCQGGVDGWPQKFFQAHNAEKNFWGSSRGVWRHVPPENF